MDFENHQMEDHHRKEHSDRFHKVLKTEFRSFKRDILAHYSSCSGENSELLTQCPGCMCIEDLYSHWSNGYTYDHSGI